MPPTGLVNWGQNKCERWLDRQTEPFYFFLFLFFLFFLLGLLLTFSPTFFQTGKTLICCIVFVFVCVFVLQNNYCFGFLVVS